MGKFDLNKETCICQFIGARYFSVVIFFVESQTVIEMI